LRVVDDGEEVFTLSVPLERKAEVAYDVRLIAEKPIETLAELLQR
jgi:hypothetical protein